MATASLKYLSRRSEAGVLSVTLVISLFFEPCHCSRDGVPGSITSPSLSNDLSSVTLGTSLLQSMCNRLRNSRRLSPFCYVRPNNRPVDREGQPPGDFPPPSPPPWTPYSDSATLNQLLDTCLLGTEATAWSRHRLWNFGHWHQMRCAFLFLQFCTTYVPYRGFGGNALLCPLHTL